MLWVWVLATFLVDASLALSCGFLLSDIWLRGGDASAVKESSLALRLSSMVLCISSLLLLCLLVVSFSGRATPSALMAMAPDVCATHSGTISLGLCVAASVLCLVTWLPVSWAQRIACWALVVSCLGLHGAVGHAAFDGLLSLTQGLQWVHVAGMAVWSGGVMVSGFVVAPRLSRKGALAPARAYLLQLSKVSTWAVAAVALSGIVKSYRATEGSLLLIRSSHWGQILLIKAAVVTATILLGGGNRWLLRSGVHWSKSRARSTRQVLRTEAVCMAGVLLLSAWLANSVPPLE